MLPLSVCYVQIGSLVSCVMFSLVALFISSFFTLVGSCHVTLLFDISSPHDALVSCLALYCVPAVGELCFCTSQVC